jgi:N-acetylmuramate 1-kinase
LPVTLELENAAATELLGEDLARALKRGDVLALSGEIGAGKSTLARALIRAIADEGALEVPSPTFTLVQEYAVRIPISHFDLYRLNDPDEARELGLSEAIETGICLIEWPERAGALLAQTCIRLELTETGSGRTAAISGPQEAMERIARTLAIRDFLQEHGLADASRRWFQGDASTRAFELVKGRAGPELVLMDHPEKPDLSPVVNGRSYRQTARITWTVAPFIAVAGALQGHGFAAPQITAQDRSGGLLLMENLGQGKITDADGKPVACRYCAAVELLAELHATKIGRNLPLGGGETYQLPPYDRDALMIEARLMLDWYVPRKLGRAAPEAEAQRFESLWDGLIGRLAEAETGMILRDYHSPNIIWREDRQGKDRIGLVDIQDALYGPLSYDVSSLAQDARVSIPSDLEADIVSAYVRARVAAGGFDEASFRLSYAITALQRATKILGIFVRLDQRDGKPDYLKHLPRIEDYVRRAIRHPALANLAEFYSSFDLT